MNRKKLLAVIISLVLAIAVVLPGTLAISADQDSSQSTLSVDTEPTPSEPEPPADPEPSAPGEQPADETPEQPADENPEQPAEETPADPVMPAYSTHIDGCSDACPGENCPCGCHLFAKIMACQTLDEIWAIIEAATDDAIAALTYEQNAQIDAKIAALEPAPAPAIVVEQSTDETVPSEIVYPTVNYTYVAPLVEPVTGDYR